MESTPGRGSLNYGLILLFLALIAYAAIGLTLGVASDSGDELQGLDERTVEAGEAPSDRGARGGEVAGGVGSPGLR